MKDLIISWDDSKGFYCNDQHNRLLFVLLDDLVKTNNLIVNRSKCHSETEYYFHLKDMNPNYNIELREEDGSHWIFG